MADRPAPPTQLSAVVGLLEAMLDPLASSLANASMEDEPISEEETRAVSASKAWLKNHEPIPHKDVLAQFGLTSEDFETHGPHPARPSQQGPVTMGNKIAWTDQAKADLRSIDQATALRILHVVARYLSAGEGDGKRLQDVEPPEFRCRSASASTISETPSWCSP